MEIREIKIERIFSMSRLEYRARGKYLRFGMQLPEGKVFEVEVRGHPEIEPGRYLVCGNLRAKKWSIFAHAKLDNNVVISEASLAEFAFQAVALLILLVILTSEIHDIAQTGRNWIGLVVLAAVPVLALLWSAQVTAQSLYAHWVLKQHIARDKSLNNH